MTQWAKRPLRLIDDMAAAAMLHTDVVGIGSLWDMPLGAHRLGLGRQEVHKLEVHKLEGHRRVTYTHVVHKDGAHTLDTIHEK